MSREPNAEPRELSRGKPRKARKEIEKKRERKRKGRCEEKQAKRRISSTQKLTFSHITSSYVR